MKKLEKVKIVLDEEEQKIYSDFIDLINRIDRCLGKEDYQDYLARSLSDFLDDFDEIVEDW